MLRSRRSANLKAPLANPENVKPIPFKDTGKDPASLVGQLLISATPIGQYPLTLSFRQTRRPPLDVQIHSVVLGRFFNIEVCDLLREHLSKASDVRPLKVIAATLGTKRVEYSAPYCMKKRSLFRKKQTDVYDLIGLQLQGMSRMGWIWAEDLDRSFEEGQLKASVYIPMKPITTNHRPRRMERLSAEDLKRFMVIKRAADTCGGAQLITSILEAREVDMEADLSPTEVEELEFMVEKLEADRGRTRKPLSIVEEKDDTELTHRSGELSDVSELSEHGSVSEDSMDLDIDL
ncbi:hypothetical protein TWF730_008965 [Orbilia blumenaviensis]|uniref:Uncharacterized protein n=1 Tax=Orbilia blumenaviensis TaxID=1796055 RepID=A0AAV9V071_9PEZI